MPPSRTGTGTGTSHSDSYLSARRSNSLPPNTFSSTRVQLRPVLLWDVNRSIPTRFPSTYDPSITIPDRYSYGDPVPASCKYLTDQVLYNYTSKKLLAGYSLKDHEYVLATIPAIGIDALYAAMQSNSSDVTPAYCHHLENTDRPMEWSHLHLFQRHHLDYNQELWGT
ncbi:hypothetical protein BDP27DRAFT_1432629 [Rhodocollybia butyracea]|uniref:Uncharacterized protein n=1 Tax=Rhodocollybia butyracea TaxID=206335 RepID=A0A9P5P943_9AGAR|nr:hypothetical protein BDP27DRAFT_1432629 [Rhodocollybia butyracea]